MMWCIPLPSGTSDEVPIDLMPGEWEETTLVFDKPAAIPSTVRAGAGGTTGACVGPFS